MAYVTSTPRRCRRAASLRSPTGLPCCRGGGSLPAITALHERRDGDGPQGEQKKKKKSGQTEASKTLRPIKTWAVSQSERTTRQKKTCLVYRIKDKNNTAEVILRPSVDRHANVLSCANSHTCGQSIRNRDHLMIATMPRVRSYSCLPSRRGVPPEEYTNIAVSGGKKM